MEKILMKNLALNYMQFTDAKFDMAAYAPSKKTVATYAKLAAQDFGANSPNRIFPKLSKQNFLLLVFQTFQCPVTIFNNFQYRDKNGSY